MRTAIIIFSGFVLWAMCLGVARLTSGAVGGSPMTLATASFIALWFVAAAVNMWVGVTRAGYSFQEELPIFLLIFLVPTVVAVFVKWKFL